MNFCSFVKQIKYWGRCKACTILDRSNTVNTGSNTARGMCVCVCVYPRVAVSCQPVEVEALCCVDVPPVQSSRQISKSEQARGPDQ